MVSFFNMVPTFQVFEKTIAIYPVMAILGVLCASFVACRAAKRLGGNVDDMIMVLLCAGGGLLVGSHLLYGITNWNYLVNLIQNLPKAESGGAVLEALVSIFGGGVFYGGLLGGLLAAYICVRKKKLSMALYSDLATPAIPLFHMFGRLGCFLGGCCYGVENDWGIVYQFSPLPEANGVLRLPIQLVEAVFNLLLFFALLYLQKKGLWRGKLLCVYLLAYAFARFVLEFWRGDDIRGHLLGLSTSQFISILLFVAVLVYLAVNTVRNKRRGAAKTRQAG